MDIACTFRKIGSEVELTPVEVGLRIRQRDNEQKAALERGARQINVQLGC